MTTEFSPQLRQSLDRLIGSDVLAVQPNWGDVAQRAARGRRRSVVLAILACFAVAVFRLGGVRVRYRPLAAGSGKACEHKATVA
jgi:hypothetical protein